MIVDGNGKEIFKILHQLLRLFVEETIFNGICLMSLAGMRLNFAVGATQEGIFPANTNFIGIGVI